VEGIAWESLVEEALRISPPVTDVTLPLGCPFASRCKPPVFADSAGRQFVVKSNHDVSYKLTINDTVAAQLGLLIGAPVLPTCLVYVAPELVSGSPELKHVRPGICYSTERIPITDSLGFEYAGIPQNSARFASLAVLYGWIGVCGDHQLVYSSSPPELVFSIDHEESIVCKGQWTIPLDAPCVEPIPHKWILDNSVVAPSDLSVILERLASVTASQIASVVAFPPEDWCITFPERVELANYIWNRKLSLCASRRISVQ
jgi:hypothetical protein